MCSMLLFLQGILREEGVQKVGGSAILDKMITEGKVKSITDSSRGIEMLYFPRVTFGEKESFGKQQQMSRGKHTSNEAHGLLQGLIDNLNWGISAADIQALKEQSSFQIYLCT